jgi:signal transduction histidine kinase
MDPLHAVTSSLRIRVWLVLAVATAANVVLADRVLDLHGRLEQPPQWQVHPAQAHPAAISSKPVANDSGMTRASLTASCPTCVVDAGPQLPWPVVLGFASMLLALAVVVGLTSRLRAHCGLIAEIGRHRRPLPHMTERDAVGELSTELAGANQLMVELNQVASLIKRSAGDNAHALRSPLSVVKIAVRRVRAQVPADETMVNAALDAAEANVDRMSEIIDASQRLDEDTAALILAPRRPEDLASMVRDAVRRSTRQLEAMSLQVSSCLQDGVFVSAGEGMLEALLDDLLRNAAAASPQRTLISVDLVAHDHAAVLRVGDRGPWISTDALDAAFERDYTQFNRLPTIRSLDGPRLRRRRYHVANRNAELLGGRLRLDNKPGGGMSAIVWLPLA